MTVRLSELFGMELYTANGERKGKVFDLVINLEKGRVETITTEALKVKSKKEAKRIISEKSVPYRRVKAAKDIIIISTSDTAEPTQEETTTGPRRYTFRKR